jgi:hypothetical protein
LSGNEPGVSQSWYQYRHEPKAKRRVVLDTFRNSLVPSDLAIFAGANGEKKGAMYRPYCASNLTIAIEIVNLLAKTDHNFGCRKFQFRTVPIAKSGYGRAN